MSACAFIKDRVGYGLAVLPVLTDWIDTGHWPLHPREFATEVVISVVIFFGVHCLMGRAKKFKEASETDPLTGLGNRARFRSEVDAKIAVARRKRKSLALAYVDADRFKDINDAFGHHAGDEALRDLGRALARSVRQGVDGAYRLGGDEFAVLLLGVDERGCLAALNRGFTEASTTSRHSLSCSVGIVWLTDTERADDLVQRADQLMYSAKRGLTIPKRPGLGFWGTLRLRRSQLLAGTPT